MTETRRPQPRSTDWLAGLSIYGGALVGVGGVLGALLAFADGDWQAAGTCLVAAAVAFGALANALFRA